MGVSNDYFKFGRPGGGGGIVDVDDLERADEAMLESEYRLRGDPALSFKIKCRNVSVNPPSTLRRVVVGPLIHQRFTAGRLEVGGTVIKGFNALFDGANHGAKLGETQALAYDGAYGSFDAPDNAVNLDAFEMAFDGAQMREEAYLYFDLRPWGGNRANFLRTWLVRSDFNPEIDFHIINNSRGGLRIAFTLAGNLGTKVEQHTIRFDLDAAGLIGDANTEADMTAFKDAMQVGDDIEIYGIPFSAINTPIAYADAFSTESFAQQARREPLFYARVTAGPFATTNAAKGYEHPSVNQSGGGEILEQSQAAYGLAFDAALVDYPNPNLIPRRLVISGGTAASGVFFEFLVGGDGQPADRPSLYLPWGVTGLTPNGHGADADLYIYNFTRGEMLAWGLDTSGGTQWGWAIHTQTDYKAGTTQANVIAFFNALQPGDDLHWWVMPRRATQDSYTAAELFAAIDGSQIVSLTAYANADFLGVHSGGPMNPQRGQFYLEEDDELFYAWENRTGRHDLGWVQHPIKELDDSIEALRGIFEDAAAAELQIKGNNELVIVAGAAMVSSNFYQGRDVVEEKTWEKTGTGAEAGPTQATEIPNTILHTTVHAPYVGTSTTLRIARIDHDSRDDSRKRPIAGDRVRDGSRTATVLHFDNPAGEAYSLLALEAALGADLAAGAEIEIDRLIWSDVAKDTVDGALTAHGEPTQPTVRIEQVPGSGNFIDVTFRTRNGLYLGAEKNGARIIQSRNQAEDSVTHNADLTEFNVAVTTAGINLMQMQGHLRNLAGGFFEVSAITGNPNTVIANQAFVFGGGVDPVDGATVATLDHTHPGVRVGDVAFFPEGQPADADIRQREITAAINTALGLVVNWSEELDFAYRDGAEIRIERSDGYTKADGLAGIVRVRTPIVSGAPLPAALWLSEGMTGEFDLNTYVNGYAALAPGRVRFISWQENPVWRAYGWPDDDYGITLLTNALRSADMDVPGSQPMGLPRDRVSARFPKGEWGIHIFGNTSASEERRAYGHLRKVKSGGNDELLRRRGLGHSLPDAQAMDTTDPAYRLANTVSSSLDMLAPRVVTNTNEEIYSAIVGVTVDTEQRVALAMLIERRG